MFVNFDQATGQSCGIKSKSLKNVIGIEIVKNSRNSGLFQVFILFITQKKKNSVFETDAVEILESADYTSRNIAISTLSLIIKYLSYVLSFHGNYGKLYDVGVSYKL